MPIYSDQLTIPPADTLNKVGAPRPLSLAASGTLIPLVYGQTRVDGRVVNVLMKANSKTTVLVQVAWCHACHSVGTYKWNGEDLPSTATATTYTGSQSTADAALVSAFSARSITYGDTLAGIAYSVFAIPVDEFSGELRFSALISGRKVFDPRKAPAYGGVGSHVLGTPSTWEYSDNPALCLADWIASSLYGAAWPLDWQSVWAQADVNAAPIGAPSETHRIIALVIEQVAPIPDMADVLRAYAGCWLVPTSAGIKLVPDAAAGTVATYLHQSGQIAAISDLTLRNAGDSPTTVEVIYTDATEVPYREGRATASLPGAGTTLPWRQSVVRMPGLTRHSQAVREAAERLNKLSLSDLSCQLDVFDIGMRHEVGDVVEVSHPVGLTLKKFRVAGPPANVSPGVWRLNLAEYDPAVYSTSVVTAPTYPNPGLVLKKPAALTGNLLKNSSFEVDSDGNGSPDYWTQTNIGTGLTHSHSLSTTAMHGRKSYQMALSGFTSPSNNVHQRIQTIRADVLPRVIPGRRYWASAEFRPSTTAYQANIVVRWYDASLVLLSGDTHNEYEALTSTTAWTKVWTPALTAPATAAYAAVGVGIRRPSTGDTTEGNMKIDAAYFGLVDSTGGYWPGDSTDEDLLPGSATEVVHGYDATETVTGTDVTAGSSGGATLASAAFTNNTDRTLEVFCEMYQEGEITVTAGASGSVDVGSYPLGVYDTGITVPPDWFIGSADVMRSATQAGGKLVWNHSQGAKLTVPPGLYFTFSAATDYVSVGATHSFTMVLRRSSCRILVLKT